MGADSSWRSRRLRRWTAGAAGLLLLAAAWLLVRGLTVQEHLTSAREHLDLAQEAVRTGNPAAARVALDAAARRTARARSLTADPVWSAVGALPLLGRTTRAVTSVAATADSVTRSVLPPLADAAETFDLSAVLGRGGTDLGAVSATMPVLQRAHARLARLQRRTEAVDGPLLWPVGGGVRDLRAQLADLTGTVELGMRTVRLVPPMLGVDGPRTYLLAVQNPAEARGTGGILGAYGVVVADGGRVSVREIGPNSRLRGADRLPVDLGPDFAGLYGDDPALWVNANMSPYFPYAAQIWLELWERQFDERLDGVLALDPVVLGSLVGATSPVRLPDGTRLTGRTTADFVMRDVYRRYPTFEADVERDELLADIGATVVRQLLDEDNDPAEVAGALADGVDEGRVLLFSARAAEQRDLAGTTISGAPDRTRAPRLEVVVNNGAANKLDYYLARTVRWELGPCRDGTRRTRVTLTVTNRAPRSGLPAYVLGNVDLPRDGRAIPKGTNRLLVSVFSTAGSRLLGGEIDRGPMRVRRGQERGQTVTAFTVDLAAGQRRTVVLDLAEPARPEQPLVSVQPLVRDQRTVITGGPCAT